MLTYYGRQSVILPKNITYLISNVSALLWATVLILRSHAISCCTEQEVAVGRKRNTLGNLRWCRSCRLQTTLAVFSLDLALDIIFNLWMPISLLSYVDFLGVSSGFVDLLNVHAYRDTLIRSHVGFVLFFLAQNVAEQRPYSWSNERIRQCIVALEIVRQSSRLEDNGIILTTHVG